MRCWTRRRRVCRRPRDAARRAACRAGRAALLRSAADVLRGASTRHKRRRRARLRRSHPETRDLLARAGQRAAWVLFKLDGGLDHILVDEAQDTNPEQWGVIVALAEEFFAGEGARGESAHDLRVGRRPQAVDLPLPGRRSGRSSCATRGFPRERASAAASVRSAPPSARPRGARGRRHRLRRRGARGRRRVERRPSAPRSAGIGESGEIVVWPPRAPDRDRAARALGRRPVRERRRPPQARLAGGIAREIASLRRHGQRRRGERADRAGDIMVLVRRRTSFVDEMVRA